MSTYDDVLLVDQDLNRITRVSVDYYIKDSYVLWSGYIYNDTDEDVIDCKITTSSSFDGIFSITGGDITEYTAITSNLDTTCNLGTVVSGGTEHISLLIYISGGSSLDGLQTIPLYITK